MRFYFSDIIDINKFSNTDLCVLLDDIKIDATNKNLIISCSGIFQYNGESENEYYINVATKMKSAGFNGFKDWISKLINHFDNTIYHDELDKPILYNNVIFLTNNVCVKKYIHNIFSNFGFHINDFKINKIYKNALF